MLRTLLLGLLGLLALGAAPAVANTAQHAGAETGGTRPTPRRKVPPTYPVKMLYRGVPGCVNIAFTVGADGLPGDFRVWAQYPQGSQDPRGARAFAAAAKAALRGWRFVPGRVDGRAVATDNVHQEFLFLMHAAGRAAADAQGSTLSWVCKQVPLHGVKIVAVAAKGAAPGTGSSAPMARIPAGVLPVQAPSGTVRLGFCVDAKGRVADTVVERSSPQGVYDAAARAALVATRFDVRKVGGAAVASCGLKVRVRFDGRHSGEVGTIADLTFKKISGASPVPQLVVQKRVPISLPLPAGMPRPKVAKVEVRMCIEKDGEPSRARVVQADPPKYFDAAALATVSGWHFAPVGRRMCDVYRWVRLLLGGPS